MQIISSMSKSTLLAALLALSSLLPANAAAPASREYAPILVSAENIQAPSEEQAVELADRAIRAFMTSVRAKSMQSLWNHVSLQLREKFSVAQLDEAFKAFYGLSITGDPLAGKSPIFTNGPTVDRNGNLVVDGYYTTSPSRLDFHLLFAMEGRTWKVISINVSAKPIGAPNSQSSVPNDRDLAATKHCDSGRDLGHCDAGPDGTVRRQPSRSVTAA